MTAIDPALVKSTLAEQAWRLNHLYAITDKDGKKIPFEMNDAQQKFLTEIHSNNLILKARQLGFSTFINLLQLDTVLFVPNTACGVIAHTDDAAMELFRRNIKFPYDHLPDVVKTLNPPTSDSAHQIRFKNGSGILVATSMRSGTIQILHISEFGKICNQFPHRAREIVTGSLETVGKGNLVVIESTAEGKEGYFYEYVQTAKARSELGKKPGITDYRLHFFPWWQEPTYRLSAYQPLTPALIQQFEVIESTMKTTLDAQQRNWYAAKAAKLGDDVYREYPGTIDEAFYLSTKGAYFISELSAARKAGRIGKVPHQPAINVNTWWDLGMDDCTAIWFTQDSGREIHCIDYYEMDGEGLAHYRDLLDKYRTEKGYRYGTHTGPHDLMVREWGGNGQKRIDTAANMGIKFEFVPAVKHKADAIQAARNLLGHVWIDETSCARGLKCLESYKKEWDEARGTYRDKPAHDWASHGADSFMTLACGHKFAVARQSSQAQIPSAAGWT